MMQYKGYVGKVVFDDEAGIFHGEVVGLRDVVTFQGDSVKSLRKAFKESVDDYLDFCRQRGETPEKPCSGKFVVRIPPQLHSYITMAARAKGESLNSFIEEILEKELETTFPEVELHTATSRRNSGTKPAAGLRRSKSRISAAG